MKKVAALFITGLLLTSCNLTAQLIGGGREFTHTETYVLQGDEHSFEVTFTLRDGNVAEMMMEPQATTPAEHAEQLAFSANVREYVLLKTPAAIVLPTAIGEASPELIGAFRNTLSKLQSET